MKKQIENITINFEAKKRKDLIASLAIDALGMVTYLFPALGETADVILAPIISILIYAVHRTTFGAVVGFFEEIIPFTDIIPSATIIWAYRYIFKRSATLKDFASEYSKKEKIIMEEDFSKLTQ